MEDRNELRIRLTETLRCFELRFEQMAKSEETYKQRLEFVDGLGFITLALLHDEVQFSL